LSWAVDDRALARSVPLKLPLLEPHLVSKIEAKAAIGWRRKTPQTNHPDARSVMMPTPRVGSPTRAQSKLLAPIWF